MKLTFLAYLQLRRSVTSLEHHQHAHPYCEQHIMLLLLLLLLSTRT